MEKSNAIASEENDQVQEREHRVVPLARERTWNAIQYSSYLYV